MVVRTVLQPISSFQVKDFAIQQAVTDLYRGIGNEILSRHKEFARESNNILLSSSLLSFSFCFADYLIFIPFAFEICVCMGVENRFGIRDATYSARYQHNIMVVCDDWIFVRALSYY